MRVLTASLWLLIAAHMDRHSRAHAQQVPTAIRKMRADGGDKFFPDYYAFSDDAFSLPRQVPLTGAAAARRVLQDERWAGNASGTEWMRPAFAPHVMEQDDTVAARTDGWRRRAMALESLQRREWTCPFETHSCFAIGYPNSCCSAGETCMVVEDTGLGPVGCCPDGSSCSGSVGSCTMDCMGCPSDEGGGCCIPGYVCDGVGCIPSSADVTTMTSIFASVMTGPTPSTVFVSVIITLTPYQANSITNTATEVTTESGTTTTVVLDTTTTVLASGAIPPVRPTSLLGTGPLSSYCPTGFYACLASAGGGCCQTGRDCQTTNCPPAPPLTTIVNSSGVTIVVPQSDATATAEATCASGWFFCQTGVPAEGCCPSGYGCGTASCELVQAQRTAEVAKQEPGSAAAVRGRGPARAEAWLVVGAVLVAGVLGCVGGM